MALIIERKISKLPKNGDAGGEAKVLLPYAPESARAHGLPTGPAEDRKPPGKHWTKTFVHRASVLFKMNQFKNIS